MIISKNLFRIIQALILSAVLAVSICLSVPQARAAASTTKPTGDLADAVVRIGTLGATCSGAMISPSWVLTARHCIEKTNKKGVKFNTISHVYIGDNPSRSKVYTGTTHLHPTTDLALINISDVYNGPTLPLAHEDGSRDEILTGAGFGGTPHQATIYKLTESQYRSTETTKYGFLNNGYRVWSDVIEPWYPVKGDSGSPIINSNGEIVAVFSAGSLQEGSENTFTSVTNPNIARYRDWIVSTTGLNDTGASISDSGPSTANYTDFLSDLSSVGSSLSANDLGYRGTGSAHSTPIGILATISLVLGLLVAFFPWLSYHK